MFRIFKMNTNILKLVLVAVHYSDSQNKLLSIVVIEDAVQVISETFKRDHHDEFISALSVFNFNYSVRTRVTNTPALIFSAICSMVSLRSVMCLRSSSIRSSQGEMRFTSKSGIS